MFPLAPVKRGQSLGPGTFSVGSDGVLYISAFDGSDLRLSESGTIRYDGDDRLCQMDGPGNNLRSNFHFIAGKLQISVKRVVQPLHCYHVILPQASTSMANGGCVMCMHGGGTYLFVSSGRLMFTEEHHGQADSEPLHHDDGPVSGAMPTPRETLIPIRADHAQIIVGNGKVGVIGVDGELRLAPLSALTATTQNCLLAGFNPDVVEGDGKKTSTGPDQGEPPGRVFHPPRRFVVSPTQ